MQYSASADNLKLNWFHEQVEHFLLGQNGLDLDSVSRPSARIQYFRNGKVPYPRLAPATYSCSCIQLEELHISAAPTF